MPQCPGPGLPVSVARTAGGAGPAGTMGRHQPMSFILTPGQDGDNPQLVPPLEGISVRREQGGRPRSRPEAVLADRAYSYPSTRQALPKRRIRFTSPERSDQKSRYAKRAA